ncbi:hypothetical protein ACFX13_031626 [Malus domestica]
MAVEARHLNLFPSQLIPNRDIMNLIKGNGDLYKYPDWVRSAVIHRRNLRHEVRNGEAAEKVSPVSLITVTECHPRLSIKAPNGEDAIKFYVAILGAVELEHETNLKHKTDQKRLYIYNAKLKLGSFTFLVTESASVVDSGNGEVLADVILNKALICYLLLRTAMRRCPRSSRRELQRLERSKRVVLSLATSNVGLRLRIHSALAGSLSLPLRRRPLSLKPPFS